MVKTQVKKLEPDKGIEKMRMNKDKIRGRQWMKTPMIKHVKTSLICTNQKGKESTRSHC
jgi:hypothetical protein